MRDTTRMAKLTERHGYPYAFGTDARERKPTGCVGRSRARSVSSDSHETSNEYFPKILSDFLTRETVRVSHTNEGEEFRSYLNLSLQGVP